MGLEIDDIKVEQRVTYHQPDLLTDECKGYADVVTSNILIESDEPKEKLQQLKETATANYPSYEGYLNETEINGYLLINGEYFDEHHSVPGIPFPDAGNNGVIYSADENPITTTFNSSQDAKSGLFDDGIAFKMVEVAQKAGDEENPYKTKARVRYLVGGCLSWDMYCDDAELFCGESTMPTSLFYSWDRVMPDDSIGLCSYCN